MLRIVTALAMMLLLGCSSPTVKCTKPFVGDRTKDPSGTMVITDGMSGRLGDVTEGASVPLSPPPQGGYVIFAGLRARDFDPCGAEMTGTLRAGASVVAFDTRPADLKPSGDGSAVSDPAQISTFANIAVCPDFDTKDVQGQTYELDVELKDGRGRKLKSSANVVPSCMLADTAVERHCICTCSAGYTLGKCTLDADAG